MHKQKVLDMKTGRLDLSSVNLPWVTVSAFLSGFVIALKTRHLRGYLHEFGHVLAANLVGGSGHIENAHLAYVEHPEIFRFFVNSAGVGFPFLLFYVLSSRNFIGVSRVPRAFFNACMIVTLFQSYHSAGSDFAQSPSAGVFFTVVWVSLIYVRVKGRKHRNG